MIVSLLYGCSDDPHTGACTLSVQLKVLIDLTQKPGSQE